MLAGRQNIFFYSNFFFRFFNFKLKNSRFNSKEQLQLEVQKTWKSPWELERTLFQDKRGHIQVLNKLVVWERLMIEKLNEFLNNKSRNRHSDYM